MVIDSTALFVNGLSNYQLVVGAALFEQYKLTVGAQQIFILCNLVPNNSFLENRTFMQELRST